ncbi:hypothetical protein JG688_00001300, partial [Phytophthora aleatoria]
DVDNVVPRLLDFVRVLRKELQFYPVRYINGKANALAVMSNCFVFRPQISEGNTLKAIQARHPLQELLVEHYIPNDIFLDSSDSLKVVTGHNGSGRQTTLHKLKIPADILTILLAPGKSVYLKMVGLLQYMAQIGSFVPADKAEMGLVTKIFTRIQRIVYTRAEHVISMESATVSQSSFTIDCNQMAWMLNHGDGRSLFLVDEFGKGTAELDGVALLVRNHSDSGRSTMKLRSYISAAVTQSSIINYLAKKRFTTRRPRVVLTTHFLVHFLISPCCFFAAMLIAACEQEIFRSDLLEPELIVDQSLPQNGDEQCESSSDTARVVCTVMASTDAPESFSATSNAVPLYELRHGISGHSNALTCAAKCGIPLELVERAQEVLDCSKRGVPISSRRQSAGPSPEEQLAAFFSSIDNWQAAGDDAISRFLTIARMGTK